MRSIPSAAAVFGAVFATALLAGCASAPPAADAIADQRFSDQEIAYAAARLQEAEFGYGDTVCTHAPYRTQLADAQATFERAHPDYRAALDGPAPDADVVAATDTLVGQFLRAAHPAFMTAPGLTPAQRDAECAQIVAARAAADFAAKREDVRRQLSATSP